MEFINKIFLGDTVEGMKQLPDACVDCCVTSIPYFGLRDYGTAVWIGGSVDCDHKGEPMRTAAFINQNCGTGSDVKNKQKHSIFKDECKKCGAKRVDMQIGLEKTPEEYVAKIVEVFDQVYRVMKPTGTLWLNIGDSYAGGGGSSGHNSETKNLGAKTENYGAVKSGGKKYGLKQKDLIGIPWMIAFALRSAGWYLRQDIIWSKPNPMPESVTDRCTKSHEYIFLLTKSAKYFYDHVAIKTPVKDESVARLMRGVSDDHKNTNGAPGQPPHSLSKPRTNTKAYLHRGGGDYKLTGHSGNFDANGALIGDGMANKKSVWNVSTKPFSGAHFATFPQDLIVDMIKAGSSEHGCCANCGAPYQRRTEKEYKIHENCYGSKTKETQNSRGSAGNAYHELIGEKTIAWDPTCKCKSTIKPAIVLDPFMGAATTALVARKLERNYVGFELNPEYKEIGEKRLQKELGLFI